MSIQVHEFNHIPGVNDAEYIKLLKEHLEAQTRLTSMAVAKLKNPDLALIIRCGDCFYWEPECAEEGDSCGHCRNQYAPCNNQQTDMNWFCGSGERIKE